MFFKCPGVDGIRIVKLIDTVSQPQRFEIWKLGDAPLGRACYQQVPYRTARVLPNQLNSPKVLLQNLTLTVSLLRVPETNTRPHLLCIQPPGWVILLTGCLNISSSTL